MDKRPTTIVAVNGLGGLEYLWEGFRAALPASLEVRVLDLPGHGDQPPAADYRYPALVRDVATRTADLDPFPLIGWSVGAAVAWLFTAGHEGRVTRLILVEPAAPHQSPFRLGPTPEPFHAFTYASIEKALDALCAFHPTVTRDDIQRSYRQDRSGRWEPRFDPAYYPTLVEEAREHGEEIYFELGRITVPTLILRGERSLLRSEQVGEVAAALPGHAARVETVPRGGHFVIQEQPAAVAQLVLDWLGAPAG